MEYRGTYSYLTSIEHRHDDENRYPEDPCWQWMMYVEEDGQRTPRCVRCQQPPPRPIVALKAFYDL